MPERGVCICPQCGCQFSDDQKAKLERMDRRRDWRRRPLYRFRLWRLERVVTSSKATAERRDWCRDCGSHDIVNQRGAGPYCGHCGTPVGDGS